MAEQPIRSPIPERVLRCVTHHGCDCREWAVAEAERFAGILTVLRNAEAQGLTIHVATRATCAEHLEHGDDKATEPLAATSAPEPLDVDELARALHDDWEQNYRDAIPCVTENERAQHWPVYLPEAKRLVARLSQPGAT